MTHRTMTTPATVSWSPHEADHFTLAVVAPAPDLEDSGHLAIDMSVDLAMDLLARLDVYLNMRQRAREDGRQRGLAEAQGSITGVEYDADLEAYVALVVGGSGPVHTRRIPLSPDAVTRLRETMPEPEGNRYTDEGLAEEYRKGVVVGEERGREEGRREAQEALEYQREQEDRHREQEQDMTVEQHRRSHALYQARSVLEVSAGASGLGSKAASILPGGTEGLLEVARWIEQGDLSPLTTLTLDATVEDVPTPRHATVLPHGAVIHHTAWKGELDGGTPDDGTSWHTETVRMIRGRLRDLQDTLAYPITNPSLAEARTAVVNALNLIGAREKDTEYSDGQPVQMPVEREEDGLPAGDVPALTRAVLADVRRERARQIAKGYTPEHDDQHTLRALLRCGNYGSMYNLGADAQPKGRDHLLAFAAVAVAALERRHRLEARRATQATMAEAPVAPEGTPL